MERMTLAQAVGEEPLPRVETMEDLLKARERMSEEAWEAYLDLEE